MRDLTVEVFEHLEITSEMDVDKRIKYIKYIPRGPSLNKYRQVLTECKEPTKGLAGDQWTLGLEKSVTMEQLWDWSKVDTINGTGDLFSGPEHCTYSEKEMWFELGNSIQKKHMITFQDHVKYIRNDIMKPFRVGTLQYYEHVCEMHDLAKYLPPLR